MENKNQCEKCNSDNTIIISEPIEIEKKCNYWFLIAFIVFSLISIVGIILIFKAGADLLGITISNTDDTATINTLIDYYLKSKQAQSHIYIGLIVFAVGIIPQTIMAMLHSLASKYSVKNKLKIVCLDCKHKMNYFEYAKQQKTESEKDD